MKHLLLALLVLVKASMSFGACYNLSGGAGKFDLCLNDQKTIMSVKETGARCIPSTYQVTKIEVSAGSHEAYRVTGLIHADRCSKLEIVTRSEVYFENNGSLQITSPRGTYVFFVEAKN